MLKTEVSSINIESSAQLIVQSNILNVSNKAKIYTTIN